MSPRNQVAISLLILLTIIFGSSHGKSEALRFCDDPMDIDQWFHKPPGDLSDGNCLPTSQSLDAGYHYAWKQFLYMVGSDENGAPPRLTRFGDVQGLFRQQGAPLDYPGTTGQLHAGTTGKHITLNETQQAAAIVPVADKNG